MAPVPISLKSNRISNPKLIFSIIAYMGLKDSHHYKSCSCGHIRNQFLIRSIIYFKHKVMKFKRGTKLNKISLPMSNKILIYVPPYQPMLQSSLVKLSACPCPMHLIKLWTVRKNKSTVNIHLNSSKIDGHYLFVCF